MEFKTSFDKASIAALVAIANAQGGTVLLGVSDAGSVQGVTLGKETLNEWLGQIKSATSPALIPEIIAHSIDGKTIVDIEIGEFPVKPVNTRGRYYKRDRQFKPALNTSEIADLYMQSLQPRGTPTKRRVIHSTTSPRQKFSASSAWSTNMVVLRWTKPICMPRWKSSTT